MNIHIENLYENIFSGINEEFSRLRVISGYASPNFLTKVINDFPFLEIDLFIGMTSQGVSEENHYEFLSLMAAKNNVRVYYQIKGLPNHMKILEFSNSLVKKTFVGSANFSENGFFKNREIMVNVSALPEQIFRTQFADSKLCTDNSIGEYIAFYKNEAQEFFGVKESNEVIKATSGFYDPILFGDPKSAYGTSRERGHVLSHNKFKVWRDNIDIQYYNSFEITVVLPEENNVRWADKGINAWVNGRLPVIEQTPKLLFNKVFPVEEEFYIYTDDDRVLHAQLTGSFNGNLSFLNIDLHDYLRERIGLDDKRSISYNDLKSAGCEKMYFTRIDRNNFLMSF